jgi:hypothetical protein
VEAQPSGPVAGAKGTVYLAVFSSHTRTLVLLIERAELLPFSVFIKVNLCSFDSKSLSSQVLKNKAEVLAASKLGSCHLVMLNLT